MAKLPQEAIELSRTSGFDKLYFRNLATAGSNRQAYEMTEEKYREYFGRNRYSSYDSFRKSISRRL